MSDTVAELLLVLYETNRATAYSNLFVGIVFGELLSRSCGMLSKVTDDFPKIKIPSLPFPLPIPNSARPAPQESTSFCMACRSTFSCKQPPLFFSKVARGRTDDVHPFPSPSAPDRKSQRWRAALGPTPFHARRVDCDVRAWSCRACPRNVARVSAVRAPAQSVEQLAMVRAPHQRNRGRLRDHHLSRRKLRQSLSFPPPLPFPLPHFSPRWRTELLLPSQI